MKLLVDMNLSPRWAAELQSRGFESIHWSQVGAATAPDDEVLAWCAVNGHVLFTLDLDFGAILAASKGRSPSVVQLRTENVLPEATLPRVAGALRQLERDLARGAALRLAVRLAPYSRARATSRSPRGQAGLGAPRNHPPQGANARGRHLPHRRRRLQPALRR